MANEAGTFQELNEECATAFLQHAVVVDNGLYFHPDEQTLAELRGEAAKAEFTDPAEIRRGEASALVDESGLEMRGRPRDLDARILVDAFADLGIICSPYCPDNEAEIDQLVGRTISVARHADIVVLDWDLGQGHDKVVEIIKKILAVDSSEGGRLRLIAVYTGEKELNTIQNTLGEELFVDGEVERAFGNEDEGYSIQYENCRIIFANKVSEGFEPIPGAVSLKENELPGHLVSEFSKMTDGLMPNVALSAITAVRRATHHILAKFNGSLDAALLTHRALLLDTEEAEQFAIDLVADEIDAILEASEIGSTQFGIDCIESWLKDRTEREGLKIGLSGVTQDDFSVAEALKLLEHGLNDATNVVKKDGNNISKNYISTRKHQKEFQNLFAGSKASRNSSLAQMSRISVTKREAWGRPFLPRNWNPILSLGAIVVREPKEDDAPKEYYLCVQPVCDSVRIPAEGQQFLFLPMSAVEADPDEVSRYDVALAGEDGNVICLKTSYKAHEQVIVKFKPKSGETVIRASKERASGRYYFMGTATKKYYWFADLKDVVAIRDADRVSASLRRVGMGEFEWLRVRSSHG